MPRPAPPHLEGISGAELRRREERRKGIVAASQKMLWHRPLPVYGPTRDDVLNLRPGTTRCWLCGADVVWTFDQASHDHAENRDGTLHAQTCQGAPSQWAMAGF